MSCGNKSEVWITTARDLEKDLCPDFLIAYYILLNIALFILQYSGVQIKNLTNFRMASCGNTDVVRFVL